MTSPLSGLSSRFKHLINVDLPAPLEPIIPKISCSLISNDTLSTALTILS